MGVQTAMPRSREIHSDISLVRCSAPWAPRANTPPPYDDIGFQDPVHHEVHIDTRASMMPLQAAITRVIRDERRHHPSNTPTTATTMAAWRRPHKVTPPKSPTNHQRCVGRPSHSAHAEQGDGMWPHRIRCHCPHRGGKGQDPASASA